VCTRLLGPPGGAVRVGGAPSGAKTSTLSAGHPKSPSQGYWSQLRSGFPPSGEIWRIVDLLTRQNENNSLWALRETNDGVAAARSLTRGCGVLASMTMEETATTRVLGGAGARGGAAGGVPQGTTASRGTPPTI